MVVTSGEDPNIEGVGAEMGLHTPWRPGWSPTKSDLALIMKVHGAKVGGLGPEHRPKPVSAKSPCQCPETLERIESGQSILGIGTGSQWPAELGKGSSALLFCPNSSQCCWEQCCFFVVSASSSAPLVLALPAHYCLPQSLAAAEPAQCRQGVFKSGDRRRAQAPTDSLYGTLMALTAVSCVLGK